MSRCFPYPPPGCVKKEVIRDEALIDSIKIQREDKKAKKEKKRERKREKKEKKARENVKLEDKHSHKKRHKDERHKEEEKDGGHGKKRKHETDNIDKSGLTEEHEQPVDSQNSSDSTVNSNKRQKQDLSPDGRQNSASVFRIRLPLQRHKDPEVLPKEEQPCQLPLQKHNVPVVPPRDKRPCQMPLQNYKDAVVLPREKQFPLQKKKGPIVLPRENQPCQLSLQKHKDSVLVPREKQPCQLPLQKPKDPVVVLKEEQPCRLPLQRHKDAEASQEQPFRLSLQRHKDQKVLPREEHPYRLSLQKDKNKLVLPIQEQPCSLSVRADIACIQGTQEQAPKQGRYEVQPPCSTSESAGKELPSRPGKEKHRKSGGGSVSKTSEYSELFESWTLPPLVHILPMNVDDEEWWLETIQNRDCGADKRKVVNDSLSCGDSTSWPPRACLLPEADIYALPYTVPF